MSKYKVCRGFKDLMPSDYKKYKFLKDTIEEVANVYGYKMMKSACIEECDLYQCNFDDDISKNLFSIEGRFTNSVSLNYDSTISILRSVVENKLYVDKSLPLKLMYLNEEFKYFKKNPSDASKYVFGFECIGDKSVYLDVENILLSMKLIEFLGQGGYVLKINNLSEDDTYYSTFKETLTNLGVDFEESEEVKGLSYYSGIAYEIDVDEFDSLITGGRYDYLVDNIGGVKVDCVGCKINFDNLVKLLDKYEMFPSFREEVDFYIIPVGDKAFKYALQVSELIRDIGAVVEIHYKEYDLKRLDDLIDRVDVTYTVVIEEENVNKETLRIRNSLSKKESLVKLKDFIKDLESIEEHHH